MRYPIAIEPGNDTTAFGVIFPDLLGCFSADDTLEVALNSAKHVLPHATWTLIACGIRQIYFGCQSFYAP
jgi:hypothetical protein